MRAWALVATVLLAGCASDPPAPLVAGEPTFRDGPAPEPLAPAVFSWTTIAQGDMTLGPSMSTLAVTVPNGTIRVMANFTLQAGAGYDLFVQLGECQREVEAFLSGPSELPVDCGGVIEGATQLQVTLAAGAIQALAKVIAVHCAPQPGANPCPGAAPVPER